MKALRITCWLMIAALLLHGSGVLSSVHKIRHHSGDVSLVVGCDHDAPGTTHEHGEKQPTPEREDEDCDLCLGLAGLHLIPVMDSPRVVAAAPIEEERAAAPCEGYAAVDRREHPARAPPAC